MKEPRGEVHGQTLSQTAAPAEERERLGDARPSASPEQSCDSRRAAERDSPRCNADRPGSPQASGRRRRSSHATAGLFSLELPLLYRRVKNNDQHEDPQRFRSMLLGTHA